MKQKGVAARLAVLTVGLMSGLLIVGGFGAWTSKSLSMDLSDVIDDALPVVRTLTLIDMVHDGVRGSVLQAQLGSLHHDRKSINSAADELAEHKKNVSDYFDLISQKKISTESRELVRQARVQMDDYFVEAENVLQAARQGDGALLEKVRMNFDGKFSALEEGLEQLGERLENENQTHFRKSVSLATKMQWGSWFILFTVLILGSALAFFIARRLSSDMFSVSAKVISGSGHVDSAVNQLASASMELSKAAQLQSATIQGTSSAVEEISSMVKRSSDLAKDAENQSNTTRSNAVRGNSSMDKLSNSIISIGQSSRDVGAQMEDTNFRLGEIIKIIQEVGQKTRVIDDIVFQTRLLSFNASVEAARAGEHGKGFSVVAEEVGKLAQMSGVAAQEINALVEESLRTVQKIVQESKIKLEDQLRKSREAIDGGQIVAEECSVILREIVQASEAASEMVTQISSASDESSKGVAEIAEALHRLESTTQTNAQAAHMCADSSVQLKKQVLGLKDAAGSLSSLVEGSSRKSAVDSDDATISANDRYGAQKTAA